MAVSPQKHTARPAGPGLTLPSRCALAGAAWGFALALAVSLFSQIQPRLAAAPGWVFSGAPQGLDQWVYFAICQAIWRSPTQCTYAYPFALFWPTPAVVFQLPLMLAAWVGRLTGLPVAFELGRIAGTTLSGAALGALGARLCPGRRWRRWFWIALVLGGAWYAWYAVLFALRTAGVEGLTEWSEYVVYAMGRFYFWLPFVSQNVTYPLEAFYHALVFGVLACLVARRNRTALLLGVLVWMSNPFPAIAISVVVGAWWGWRFWESRGQARRQALQNLLGWAALGVLAYAYYHLFLVRWPALKDLERTLAASALTPPLGAVQRFVLWAPWGAGLLWSLASRAGRKHVWRHPYWRLFGLLAVTQTLLTEQGLVLGEAAMQPFHFNRGYMHVGMAAVFWRAVMVWSRSRRRVPAWAVAAVLLTLPDQALYWARFVSCGIDNGTVPESMPAMVHDMDGYPPGRLVFVDKDLESYAGYFAGCSSHAVCDVPDHMSIPFAKLRQKLFDDALAGRGKRLDELGVELAVLYPDGDACGRLLGQGWVERARRDKLVLLEAPQSRARATPAAPGRPRLQAAQRAPGNP